MKRIIFCILAIAAFAVSCAPKPSDKPVAPKAKEELVITIPLVTWGGYAALFAANNGPDPKEDSLFWKYGKFKVKLVQEENPANQLQGFANGTYQILWSTMDMLPLLYDSLAKDPRTAPKVLGVFDYSAGGDGIISRGIIKDAKGLKGKKVVTSQFTPSHFFLLWYLDSAGLKQSDVNVIFAPDAIAAKDTFVNDATIDACVTWSPFVYDITDPKKDTFVKGSKLLVTSAKDGKAYGIIADVYLAGGTFVKEHPEVVDVFCKAMIEGYGLWDADKQKVAKMIADLFGIKGGVDEVMAMFGDVTIGGKAENIAFFNKGDSASAYRIFDLAVKLYRESAGALDSGFKVDASEVIFADSMLKAAK